MLLILNLIWIFYAVLEGFREGFYWHFKLNSKKDCDFEIHSIFAIQRGIFLLIIGILLFNYIGWYSIISILSMSLIFSFFHNGSYYTTRNKLDNNLYKLGWQDHSSTATAKLTKLMTYKNRTLFMIIGILSQIIIFLFNK